MSPRPHSLISLIPLTTLTVVVCSGCSVFSLFGAPLPCDSDDACDDGDVCVRGYCFAGDEGEGEGEVVGEGEGEGDIVVGEGEGDIVVGEGEGEGEVIVGEGEGEVIVGEGEGEVVVCVDLDGDKLGEGCIAPDCDEGDPATFTVEICDGKDNDCDGDIDEDNACGCALTSLPSNNGSKDVLVCHEQLLFDDAVAFCAARPGYRLLTLRNAAEDDAFADQVAGGVIVWLGFTDRASEGNFVDESGAALGFTAFQSGQPNNIGDQDCLIDSGKGWIDVDCDDMVARVACERVDDSSIGVCVDVDGDGFGKGCGRGPDCDDENPFVAVASFVIDDDDGDGRSGTADIGCVAPVPAPPLPQAPSENPDCDDTDRTHALACHCGTFTSQQKTFALCFEGYDQATWAGGCAEAGGALAVVANVTQATAIGNRIETDRVLTAWINGDDRAVEGTFAISDNSPLPFAGFASGEPNNTGGNEDCLELRSDHTMNDTECDDANVAICGAAPAP